MAVSPVPQLELRDSHVLDLVIRTNPEFGGSLDPKTTVAFAHTSARHVTDPRQIRVELRVRIAPEDNDAKKKPYWIEIAIAGYFTSREDKPEGEVPAALVENALTILYGIARGTVSSVTGSGSHGKFLLPTVAFANTAAKPDGAPRAMQIADKPMGSKKSETRPVSRKRTPSNNR